MRFFKNFCRKTCKSEKSPIQFVFSFGGIAQLVEHLHGMQGVSGSNPLTSTTKRDCHRSPSSRGLGHDPFTVGTGVRIPVGTPNNNLIPSHAVWDFLYLLEKSTNSCLRLSHPLSLNRKFFDGHIDGQTLK